MKTKTIWCLLASWVCLLLAGAAAADTPASETAARRLALIVGVGEYESSKLPDLAGPAMDARAVFELLTAAGGYGFSAGDVELLLDEKATVEGFRRAFRAALIDRARPGDIALLYYAGHGSQVRDRNGDEPDGWDESLVLHDSRTEGTSDLVDDELNGLLEELSSKTRNITVVLDSCSSGSATRDGVWAVPRLVPRVEARPEPAGSRSTRIEVAGADGSDHGWAPQSLPGLVVLSAAKDGTAALEPAEGGHGFFTSAFLDVIGSGSAEPLTWTQVSRRMPRIVAALSRGRQLPTFQGALARPVFDAREHRRPFGWEVSEVGDSIELRGIHLPGWGVGALVRIYPGAARRGATHDPNQSKATLRVQSYDGLTATASPIGRPRSPIEIGDLAILMLPDPQTYRLRVRLMPAGGPGGLAEAEAEALRAAIATYPAAAPSLRTTDAADAFSVHRDRSGGFRIYGPEGVLRNAFHGTAETQIGEVVRSLVQHARQNGLLLLRGETGADFHNGQTLEVRLVPHASPESAASPAWLQAPPNAEQTIPLGSRWQIEVTNTDDEATLLVGGAVLWNDGGIDGVPFAGDEVRLPPKKTLVLDPRAAFEAVPPVDAIEHVLIFGTRESNPVNWSLLTDPAAGIERSQSGSPLQRLIAGYLDGVRAGRRVAVPTSTWTSSHVVFRVAGPPRAHPLEGDANE